MRGLAGTRRASENHAEEEKRWRCDPLSHPALRHKNERQLADLPIGPARGECRWQWGWLAGERTAAAI